jgi:phosphatidylglycerophosphate synthase
VDSAAANWRCCGARDPVLRPVKDRVLFPLARAVDRRVHPNVLTMVGFFVGLGCASLLAVGAYGPAFALWLANRVVDGLDGAVARVQRRQTDLGGYLDLLLDFVLYGVIPIALVAGVAAPAALLLPLAALLGSFYVNAASWMYLAAVLEKRAAGAAARAEQTSVTMPTALVEGTETIVFYSLFMLFPSALAPLFGLMAALVWVGVFQRLFWAVRHL